MREIIEALTDEQISAVRILFREYADSINLDLCFEGFETELDELPGMYAPDQGGLFLATLDGAPAGCVAVRPLEPPDIAELKRLYVRPSARKHGLGEALTRRAIERARERGYRRMRLDSLPSMADAQRLYRELGFRDIQPYKYNPVSGVTYMELDLNGRPVL
ncbi:MAG TPA: GNAT family N-acetyltransferase [Bacteroidota bacterium]|nr:GNAT family N-acetyltransferase [Bacteroidota bacterium]